MVRKAALSSLATLYPEESQNRLMEAMADSDPESPNVGENDFRENSDEAV